jgi:geranylgeranyl diphosphate synthase type II
MTGQFKQWRMKTELSALRAAIPAPVYPATPFLHRMQQVVRKIIDNSVQKDFESRQLTEICEYSVSGGKLIRAVITQSIASAIARGTANAVCQPAVDATSVAIEYIHAASLMLDDEMDMDEERRGKPSAYVKFGSTAAQLGALQLMTVAFVKMSCASVALRDAYERGNELSLCIYDNVSKNLQQLGVGQYFDVFPLQTSWAELSDALDTTAINHVEDVIRKKTVTLFDVAFVNGWLSCNGDIAKLPDVHKIADNFGMLFQIADDCEDYAIDLKRAGKNASINYLNRHGIKKTKEDALQLARNVKDDCIYLGIWSEELSDILRVLKKQVAHFTHFHRHSCII